ncbi:Eukaryotic/viral aspartic protease [Phytophthora megakarya]|uniref:Eukaryotic/viral aspartic protease n=1 Tax=Phytophthora megakarya TaxID=4795 RepID=A0A225WIP7_9STRA|nr:Eukaryotic/viral aspartic protease [Phytophthora megakarya]
MVSAHTKMVKSLPSEQMEWPNGYDYKQIRGHGRQPEVQGIKKGKMSTSIRVIAKITLGWNTVYEFDIWVMEHDKALKWCWAPTS